MSRDRMTNLAMELMRLGVSQSGVTDLLTYHPLDEIERQLAYLPYRKAKRPEAFIIEAVRNRYSPPKEFFYATRETNPADSPDSLDQDAESPRGASDAEPQGHRASDPPRAAPGDLRLEQTAPLGDFEVPSAQDSDWPAE